MGTQENLKLLGAAYSGNLPQAREAVSEGADVEYMEPQTKLAALHMAVGRDHLELARYLIEEAGAQLKPDGYGRLPSVIAAQCRASDELSDFVTEREAALDQSRDPAGD